MIYNIDDICAVNGSFLVDALNDALHKAKDIPSAEHAVLINYDTIQVGSFTVAFNAYSAELTNKEGYAICAGAVEEGQINFEDEFAAACIDTIKSRQ